MADGRSSASVVAVDPTKAAKERDAAARAMLRDDGGSGQFKQFMKKGLAHTVPYTLKIVAKDDAELAAAKAVGEEVLASAFQVADTILNNFNPNSEVSIINRLPVGKQHQMSASLKRVIGCCQRVFNSSRGSFDPAVGPLVERLRLAAKEGKTLPRNELDSLINRCSLNNSFKIDLPNGIISRLHADAQLDLGGVNKGYAVDYVMEKLNAASIENVFFEWGGDVRANGHNSQGHAWSVGIVRPPSLEELRHPNKNEEEKSYIRVVELHNEAIATSGDYENLIEGPGSQMQTSIFCWDTKSLLVPSEHNIAQATVKCYSCMYADALATASILKFNPSNVRRMLEGWRFVRDTVTDYTTYTRHEERVANMFELAIENADMRAKRIAGSLPSRVIVIGGGLAGCTAAIEAANCGAQVVLLEKEKKIGGNSAKATSGINGWGTRTQAKQNIQDHGKYFERDTFLSGKGGNCDAGLVKTLSMKSADAIRWLTKLGIPLTVLSQLGGASRKRCHRAPDQKDGTPVPIGFTIMRILENHIRTQLSGKVTIMTDVHVTSLAHTSSPRGDGAIIHRVNGVNFTPVNGEPMTISADAVILATGGFSNDRSTNSLLQKYAPQLASFPTTNGTWATGDGVKMVEELNVALVDMDKVQLHPTGLLDPKDPKNRTKYLGPEALRGSGGILLNKKGERFINELDLRSVVSKAIIEQNDVYPESGGSKFAYCVLNDTAVGLFGKNSHAFYWKKLGLFEKVDTVEDLAKLIGCPLENLTRTLNQYKETSRPKKRRLPADEDRLPCRP
ncbi:NADH-dependent fumarate reductase [Angomonas deanei]|nr:NADH-dependent fumarate reductase [Angomonas deanei]|eukprot:EPY38186.1 NADH-dependent fumarate reductase [Angomonas deanei]